MVTKLTQWPHTPLGGPRERANRVAAKLSVCGGNIDVLARTGITCILLPDGYFQQAF